MNAFKLSAVALALAASFSASAMTSIHDADLAQVFGQEGVSIVADLNIHVDSFTYTNDGHALLTFSDISIKGMMIATIDLLTAAAFVPSVVGAVATQGAMASSLAASVVTAAGVATGWTGQDVVQFAFPQVGAIGSSDSLNARKASPTITAGVALGGAGIGHIQIKNLDLQGTKIWLYGHK